MRLLELRHRVHILLGAEAERPDSDVTEVTMANPATWDGPWGITVTTRDGRSYRLDFTAEPVADHNDPQAAP
ncbi:hypothetical protein ABTX81_30470 [Kitasatospora sp. NPDC097605]|uniref:hypothetical protein n=1 Tax=Kitasatospora sp. NPDC097605 TaxID=3157226 RepID=UPI00331F44D0